LVFPLHQFAIACLVCVNHYNCTVYNFNWTVVNCALG